MGWTMAHIFKLLYATKHSIILTEYFFTSSFTKPYLGKKMIYSCLYQTVDNTKSTYTVQN